MDWIPGKEQKTKIKKRTKTLKIPFILTQDQNQCKKLEINCVGHSLLNANFRMKTYEYSADVYIDSVDEDKC